MAVDYNSMTVTELKSYAKNNGIHLTQYDKTKADIIATITKHVENNIYGEYKNKTIAELKKYASDNGINLPAGVKKQDIIEAILEAENPGKSIMQKITEEVSSAPYKIKPGRTLLKNNYNEYRANYKLNVFTICHSCGEEIYAFCFTETDNDDAGEYLEITKQLKKCPRCNAKLGLNKGWYYQEYIGVQDTPDYNAAFKALKKNNDEKDKMTFREKPSMFDKDDHKKDVKDNDLKRDLTLEELKQYILYLIHMESEIYYLNERLVEIKMKDLDNNQSYTRIQVAVEAKTEKEFENKKERAEDQISQIQKTIFKPEIDVNVIIAGLGMEEPVIPDRPVLVKPVEPTLPEFKKPGLLNKKKILSENEALQKKYDEEKEKYILALSVFEEEQKAYDDKMREYEKNKIEYEIAYKTAFDEEKDRVIAEQRALLKEKKEALKELDSKKEKKVNEFLDKAPQKKVSLLLAFDEKEIKKELKKIISARNELYSYDIIYGKYRNYVALTTLYEYLDSGRCNTLGGPEGAYNLYESESRSNEIIVQLKTIVDSLETIKTNQFMLYKEMKQIKQNLTHINTSLGQVIDELQSVNYSLNDMNNYLSDIGDTTKGIFAASASTAQNTALTAKNTALTAQNTALTAYYSAQTAHYAKVNAELTDALGFMIAMK